MNTFVLPATHSFVGCAVRTDKTAHEMRPTFCRLSQSGVEVRTGCQRSARGSIAEKEYLTERIKYFGDLLKLSCVFLIAIGGGTLGLLLGGLSGTRTLLASLGVGSSIALVIFVLSLDRQIRALIRELKKV